MGPDRTPEQRFFAVLTNQGGVATSDDAAGVGLSYRRLQQLIQRGAIRPVRRGIYVAAAAKVDFYRACVISTRATTGAVISHGSALGLLLGADWRPNPRGNGRFPVDVTVPNGHRRCPDLGAVHIELTLHQSRNLAQADHTDVFGVPTTTPSRTLFDIADSTVTGPHGLGLDLALAEMLAKSQAKATQLAHLATHRLRHHRGADSIRVALEKAHELNITKTMSYYERVFLLMLATAKIRLPVPQLVVFGPKGGPIRRTDFAWPDIMLNVEIDSRRWHAAPAAQAKDTAADRRMRAEGWTVLRIRTIDIDQRPDWVLQQIARIVGTSAISPEA